MLMCNFSDLGGMVVMLVMVLGGGESKDAKFVRRSYIVDHISTHTRRFPQVSQTSQKRAT